MYLKSIEMKGFKSFADRTQLQFRDGITAVVGPNGSGKSNISDAIRWVLGEQSVKQLRGGKMEDVIFAGTQFRKPLGQASVTLTLDNSCGTLNVPYNEVNVTRRLYRSGESEYLLNNNTVRLKDIHELFMDTGIGREGYSIIGQGKIDAILSGKAEERRTLVEEAAGITKFKTRKEEGERKLKNAEENLLRVEDIISTYEERIGPLKKDKETAEKFIVLDRELTELQISVLINDLDDLDEKNRDFISGKDDATRKVEDITGEFDSQEKRTEELSQELEEAENKRQKSREAYYIRKGEGETLTSDIRVIGENIRSTRESLASLKTLKEENLLEIERQSAAILKKKEQRGLLEDELQGILKELKDLEAEGSSKDASIRIYDGKIEETAEAIRSHAQMVTKLKDDESSLRNRQEYLKGRIENISSMNLNYTNTLKLNEEGIEKLKTEMESVLSSQKNLEEEIVRKSKEVDGLKDRRESLIREIEELRRTVRDAQNREGILRNLEESHEGYIRPVKDLFSYLKKNRSSYLETAQVVGDVVTTSSQYSRAIEASLGGYVGNIIADTDKDASELIRILKKENLGRITFLPRNVIKANRIPMPKIQGVKVLGFASDLVETEDRNREIIDSILARTLVTETLKDAVEVARQTSHRVKIVTLEGDIISAGGAMTGGSQKGQGSGVISRKAEIEDLKRKIEESTRKGVALSEEEKALRETLEKAVGELTSLKEKKVTLSLESERIDERMLGFAREIDKVHDILKNSDENEDSLKEELQSTGKELETHTQKMEEAVKEQDDLNLELLKIRTEKEKILGEARDIRDSVMEAGFREREKRNRIDSLTQETAEAEERIRSLKDKNENFAIREKEGMETLTALEKDLREKEDLKTSSEKDLERMEKETEGLEMEEVRLRSLLKEENNRLTTLREEKNLLEKELLKITLSLEKYESDKDDILARLNEDLNLTVAEARDRVIPLESRNKARKRISELKSAITALGSVNLASIEEYSKVSEHYEFLTGQRNDLLSAKEEILTLIADMTKKMKVLFKENFAILSENFRETFRQLFSGGTAELVLGEGDELTGAIDIVVQPPGKKLQNINLLSGGEKVLSAIALTFGILRMKPSPFCILDEIEAALDDANVYRYATFLREFATNTQFILITHRKGTMESADVMYGVTMEEKGISKIVSVNLEDTAKENPSS